MSIDIAYKACKRCGQNAKDSINKEEGSYAIARDNANFMAISELKKSLYHCASSNSDDIKLIKKAISWCMDCEKEEKIAMLLEKLVSRP